MTYQHFLTKIPHPTQLILPTKKKKKSTLKKNQERKAGTVVTKALVI